MALIELFVSDRAQTTVTSGGTDAPSAGTTETWTVASPAMFGAAVANVSQFHVADPIAPSEIIAVTVVSGTTWTVTRGADTTTPVPHVAGFTVCQVATAPFLAGVAPLASPAFTGTPAAPTQAGSDSSTKLATTAFTAAVVKTPQVYYVSTAAGANDSNSGLTWGSAFATVSGALTAIGMSSANNTNQAIIQLSAGLFGSAVAPLPTHVIQGVQGFEIRGMGLATQLWGPDNAPLFQCINTRRFRLKDVNYLGSSTIGGPPQYTGWCLQFEANYNQGTGKFAGDVWPTECGAEDVVFGRLIDNALTTMAYAVRWVLGGGPARTDSAGTSTTITSTTVGDTSAVAGDANKVISGAGIPVGASIVSVTPGAGYVISLAATATGTPALTIGGYYYNDANNDQGTLANCWFFGSGQCISVEHSQSLLHKFDSCRFDHIAAGAVAFQGGSATLDNCSFGSDFSTGWMIDLQPPAGSLTPAASVTPVYHHQITVVGSQSECGTTGWVRSSAGIIDPPAGASMVEVAFVGGELNAGANGGAGGMLADWEAATTNSRLSFSQMRAYPRTGPGTVYASSSGSSLTFTDCDLGAAVVNWAGGLTFVRTNNALGSLTFTPISGATYSEIGCTGPGFAGGVVVNGYTALLSKPGVTATVPTVLQATQLSTAALSNPNLLPSAPGNATGGWTFGTNTTLAYVTAGGVTALSLTAVANASVSATTNTITASEVAVTPGNTYTAVASFQAAATPRLMNVLVTYLNSSRASIGGSTTFGSGATDATTGWVQSVVTTVAPAGAAYLAMAVGNKTTAPASGETHYAAYLGIMAGTNPAWQAPGAPAASVIVDSITGISQTSGALILSGSAGVTVGGSGNLSLGGQKIVSTAQGVAGTDVATVSQIPVNYPAIDATVNLTAQSAAISATTLVTPGVASAWRVSYYAKVTTAATSTSTLGALTIAWTDGDDSTAQTAVSATSSANTTTTILQGSVIVDAAAAAITYAMAYTSSGGTAMQYSLHLTAELL